MGRMLPEAVPPRVGQVENFDVEGRVLEVRVVPARPLRHEATQRAPLIVSVFFQLQDPPSGLAQKPLGVHRRRILDKVSYGLLLRDRHR